MWEQLFSVNVEELLKAGIQIDKYEYLSWPRTIKYLFGLNQEIWLNYIQHTKLIKKEESPSFFLSCLSDLLSELLNEIKVGNKRRNWETSVVSSKQLNNPYYELLSEEVKTDTASTYGIVAQRYNAK